jgi:O-antigen/teichoic acid export membrane protein
MALAGFGYWALVAQQVSMLLVQLIGLMAVTGWWPGLPHRGADMGGFLRFGGNLVASQVLTYASRNVDSVIIGSTLGASPLGLYNRAFGLMLLPLNQLNAPANRVALPVLSRLQDNRARFAQFIDAGQTFMLNIVSAILAFSAAQAVTIIALALGPQWGGAVPIFQILAIAGFFQAASNATYWVFLSKGLTRSNLHFALVSRPIVIMIVLAGSLWGVLGVATAYAVAVAVMWPFGLWWISRASDAPARLMFANGARTLSVFMIGAAASFLATVEIPAAAHVLRLLVGALALVAAVGLAALVVPAYRRDVVGMLSARKYFLPQRHTRIPGEA